MAASPKKPSPPIRLKDIASDAEVSIATVSLALRNDPSITEETKRRVMEAKKRLGYSPLRKRIKSLPAAGSEASGCKSMLYCLVGFPIRKIQYADFLDGVMTGCNQRKIRLEIKSIEHEDAVAEADLAPESVDGVILTGDFQAATVEFFRKKNPNLILLGNYSFPTLHSVGLDVLGMGESAADRLVADGHERVVHLLRLKHNYYERQFLMGLRDGLKNHGIELPDSHVLQISDLADSVPQIAEKIRGMQPTITAVTSHAANIAEACLTEIRYQNGTGSRKRTAGYAVGLVSNERVIPDLHLLNTGTERAGWLAVERLCQMKDNPPPFPFASLLPAAGWRE